MAVLFAFQSKTPARTPKIQECSSLNIGTALIVGWMLAKNWMPLGLDSSVFSKTSSLSWVILGGLLGAFFKIFELGYASILRMVPEP